MVKKPSAAFASLRFTRSELYGAVVLGTILLAVILLRWLLD